MSPAARVSSGYLREKHQLKSREHRIRKLRVKLASRFMKAGPGNPNHDVIADSKGEEWKLPGKQAPGGGRLSWVTLVRREAVEQCMLSRSWGT